MAPQRPQAPYGPEHYAYVKKQAMSGYSEAALLCLSYLQMSLPMDSAPMQDGGHTPGLSACETQEDIINCCRTKVADSIPVLHIHSAGDEGGFGYPESTLQGNFL